MKNLKNALCATLLALASFLPSVAGAGTYWDTQDDTATKVPVRIDPESGCWSYVGDDYAFSGSFKAEIFVFIRMDSTVNGNAGPVSPVLQASGLVNLGQNADGWSVYQTTRRTNFTLMPFGGAGADRLAATLCVRTRPYL